jgi:uncharacterized protein YndB with AHSA1/START domain
MGEQRISVRGRTTASPAAVYAALRDGSTWPDWSTIDTFELERPADAGDGDGPEGVGAIRRWRTKGRDLREEIVELVPERRLSYTVLSGLAIKGYRADVDLTPVDGGAEIHWHSAFRAKAPGFGGIYRRALQKATEGFVEGLGAYAAAHEQELVSPARPGDPPPA